MICSFMVHLPPLQLVVTGSLTHYISPPLPSFQYFACLSPSITHCPLLQCLIAPLLPKTSNPQNSLSSNLTSNIETTFLISTPREFITLLLSLPFLYLCLCHISTLPIPQTNPSFSRFFFPFTQCLLSPLPNFHSLSLLY